MRACLRELRWNEEVIFFRALRIVFFVLRQARGFPGAVAAFQDEYFTVPFVLQSFRESFGVAADDDVFFSFTDAVQGGDL